MHLLTVVGGEHYVLGSYSTSVRPLKCVTRISCDAVSVYLVDAFQ